MTDEQLPMTKAGRWADSFNPMMVPDSVREEAEPPAAEYTEGGPRTDRA